MIFFPRLDSVPIFVSCFYILELLEIEATFKQGQIVIRIKLPETQKEDKNHYEKSITEWASPSVKDCKKMLTFNEKFKGCFSHLSNKREVTPSTFIDFFDFSTLHSLFIRVMY